jgi:flagellar biogenesis protein FliO
MLAFFQAVQQFAVGRKLFRRSEKRLRLAETISLGPKGFIALVQLDDQELLVGGAGTSISLLAQRPFQNGILQVNSFETPAQQKSEPESLSFQETLREVPLLESTPVETHILAETPAIEEPVSFEEALPPIDVPSSAALQSTGLSEVSAPQEILPQEALPRELAPADVLPQPNTTSRKPSGSKNRNRKKLSPKKSKTSKSAAKNTRKTTRPQEVTDEQ